MITRDKSVHENKRDQVDVNDVTLVFVGLVIVQIKFHDDNYTRQHQSLKTI